MHSGIRTAHSGEYSTCKALCNEEFVQCKKNLVVVDGKPLTTAIASCMQSLEVCYEACRIHKPKVKVNATPAINGELSAPQTEK